MTRGGGKKINVVVCDEVFCPKVTFVRAEKAEVKFRKMQKVDCQGVELEALEPKAMELKRIKPQKTEPVSLADVVKMIDEPVKRRSGLKIWRSRLGTLAVLAVVIVAVVLVSLRLTGFRTFTVMSGSMDPEYPVGSLIYVKPVDYTSLKVGDVISYVSGDNKTIVTHRIVDIEVDESDLSVRRFRTKGDANNVVDSHLVHYKNVLGTPAIMIPFIGYVAHNIQQPPGIYITLVVGTLLLAWAFLPGTLEGRRKTARKSVV